MLRPGSGPPQRGQSSAMAPGKITEAVSTDASNGVERNRAHLFKSDSFAGGAAEFSHSPGERAEVRGNTSFEFQGRLAVLKLVIQSRSIGSESQLHCRYRPASAAPAQTARATRF